MGYGGCEPRIESIVQCTKRYLGGTPTRKKIRFNTFVFQKDKWDIIVTVIIRTS